jgi:phosphopantothenoylcysteine decarboxylase/phosphopantothenate--cysteine ligase
MVVAGLAGRRIVLGVCGGIAAYKAIEVCRRLVDAGARVSPVMTESATRFVGDLTFSALASEPVQTSVFDGPEAIPHTRLGQQADLVVVVPATARLIGAYAAGISSDLLTATLLATRAPVLLAPAMHTEMWEHPAVVDNLALLVRRGVHLVGPEAGHLAGGDSGYGRLSDPEDIVAAAAAILGPGGAAPGPTASGPLEGLRALVTAGGTREPLDPVRYLGNRSSGKQGHAVAAELRRRGAAVTLITASDLPGPAGAVVERVATAEEMETAVGRAAPAADLVIMAAAVADFRPKQFAPAKIKKADGVPDLILEPTPDILAGLAATRGPDQVLVGFAAETVGGAGLTLQDAADRLRTLAHHKLTAKGADLIVANDVAAPGVGFSHDTNAVIIVAADGATVDVPLAGKEAVAHAVVDAVVAYGIRRRARRAEPEHPDHEHTPSLRAVPEEQP